MLDDDPPMPLARAAGAALLLASLLLLGFFATLLASDRPTVVTLLIVFALVTIPALAGALLGLRAGAGLLLRGAPPEKGAAVYAVLVAIGSVGVVALSLRPGLDRRLDIGDVVGGAVGAVGLLTALFAAAVLVRWRTLGLRLVAAAAASVLLLAVLAVQAVSGTR